MEKGIHTASKDKLRKNKQTRLKIEGAAYLRGFEILILFSNNRMKVVDFAPAIARHAKGEYAVYAKKARFKKFQLENGNLVWGKNWDLIFPVSDIFNGNF